MHKRKREDVSLPVGGQGILRGNLSYAHAPADWAVLYVHGFGSVRGGEKAQALEAACALRGHTFAAFDFRCHGESSGTLIDLRPSHLLEDLEAIWAYLAGRGIRRLCLLGSSMGGWAAAWFTIRHPQVVVACACIAPAFGFPKSLWDRLTQAERQAWKQTGRLKVHTPWIDTEIGYGLAEEVEQYPIEQLIRHWQTPLLIFHGMKDDTVSYEQSLCFVTGATSAQIELRLYKEGDHRLLPLKEEMAEAACNFFTRWIAPG